MFKQYQQQGLNKMSSYYPNVSSNMIYVVAGDVADPTNAAAGQSAVASVMTYQTTESNKAALNTSCLRGKPIFTTAHGLNTLRENQRNDPNLSDYKVKAYPSRLINGGGGVWFGGFSDPV